MAETAALPRYIVFEGVDGAGKTTQIKLMADRFRALDITPVELCEPTYGEFGMAMRLAIAAGAAVPITEQTALFTADRKAHVRSRIRPLLALIRSGRPFVILQHRHYLSAPVYQWQNDKDAIRQLRHQQTIAPGPDLVLILDIPPALARGRIRRRDGARNNVTEKALTELHERYRRFAPLLKEDVAIVDGRGTMERVASRLWRAVEAWPGRDSARRGRTS